jgi:dihydroorotate dehydrogenase (fumarate)
MIDLTTTYLGLKLESPIVASASPLCEQVGNLRQLEDNGIGAVVLPSLFEEQLRLESGALDSDLHRGAESFGEALSYFPEMEDYKLGPEAYLELVRNAKATVSVPVIASLNGTSRSGWIDYARLIEGAGADALELNLYSLVTDPTQTSARVEQDHFDLVREVKRSIKIPLAVKLSVFFTAPANMAKRLVDAGADALVLFNRFYQADFDIEQLEVVPRLTLSQPYELLLRLRWVAIIYGHVNADLAITGGVHRAEDVLKSMMAGAKVAMMTSALLENGVGHVGHVLSDLRRWMEEHEYVSIRQMQGSLSHRNAPNPGALERMNYIRVLSSYTLNPARPNH